MILRVMYVNITIGSVINRWEKVITRSVEKFPDDVVLWHARWGREGRGGGGTGVGRGRFLRINKFGKC